MAKRTKVSTIRKNKTERETKGVANTKAIGVLVFQTGTNTESPTLERVRSQMNAKDGATNHSFYLR